MLSTYQKTPYTSGFGVRLNHTTGESAEASTTGYLHCTTEFLLYCFKKGSGNIKIDGKEYTINEGDLVLINPTEIFHCTIDGGKFHERYVLHIDETIAKHFPTSCQDLFSILYRRPKGVGNVICAELSGHMGLDKLSDCIYENIQKTDPVSVALTICKTVELLTVLCRYQTELSAQNQAPARENGLIQQVLNYLNDHFQEDITLDGIAKEFGVNKSYLSHLFTSFVGSSIWNYVIFRRINYFNSLVINNVSIEDACRQSGFQNYSNFYRLYKKYMNLTPIQFKLRQRS